MLKGHVETSLLVQCLRPHALNAGSPGSTPGQETRSHMPQLTQLRIGAAEFFFLKDMLLSLSFTSNFGILFLNSLLSLHYDHK